MSGIIGKIPSRSKIVGSIATVEQGGTGASTLTDGGILLGSGASAITATAELADGEMLVGDGTTDPAIESGATLRTSIGLGSGSAVTFATVDTGQGANELYDMNQNVLTTSGVTHDKLTATTGVLFGTDTAAANTLDDYEEGTFAATVATSGSLPATWTQVSNPGYYTKIGNIVHVSFLVSISNSTRNGSGTLKIPLPVTPSNNTGTYQRAGSISDWQFLVWAADHQLVPVALNNSAFCQLQEDNPEGATVRSYLDINAPYTNYGVGQYCMFAIQITYQAA